MPLQETSGTASYDAFGGGAAAVPTYIEDVFSTYLYTGNGNATSRTIQNNIDLSTYGGMVWIKSRSGAYDHDVTDTVRGARNPLFTNKTNAQDNNVDYAVNSFLTNGFTLASTDNLVNRNSGTYVSWTFRKQPKFFDVVTYTGNGTTNNVSHSLGSAPGFIIIKKTSGTGDWIALCRKNDTQGVGLYLNSTASNYYDGNWPFGIPPADATTLKVSWINDQIVAGCNDSGSTYVAYLFAHNAGGFGLTGTDNVISCGSFTPDASGNATVNLGYEPQWILIKNTAAADNWQLIDTMRGWSMTNYARLYPNLSNEEGVATNYYVFPSATGFNITNFANQQYIYIAIRRGPMKTPTSGTSVFSPGIATGNGSSNTFTTNFPVDLSIDKARGNVGGNPWWIDRLRGGTQYYSSAGSNAESTSGSNLIQFDSNTTLVNKNYGATTDSYVDWMFRRAPGFFDQVCYTGTGSATTQAHNLGVAPELMMVRRRDTTGAWIVYSAATGATNYLILNLPSSAASDTSAWNDTAPTSSVFTVGTSVNVNASGGTYAAYLFASVAGVSKVGSYIGTGATLTIDCGFTGGARFVLIKRTDGSEDWYIWDTARGMVAGTDPYLLLDTTGAEVNTNLVYTTSVGFQIVGTGTNVNTSGGNYLYFAIA